MEETGVVKLAKVLKVLVTLTFICNLIVLPLVPGLVGIGAEGGLAAFAGLPPYENAMEMPMRMVITFFVVCWQLLFRVWREQYTCVLSLFLIFCGVCTAVTLWQARGVLGTVAKQNTFTKPNANRMRWAAVSLSLISAAALGRTVWGFFYYRSLAPVFTYNALFVPIFLMAGLLCMVMSALFRQAAELKEENDLTI